MNARPVAALALVLAALLPAACKQEAASDKTAAGQVLPGSASDAMLPADRVTSQPPLDPGAQRAEGRGANAEATGAPRAATTPAATPGATEPAPQGTSAAE